MEISLSAGRRMRPISRPLILMSSALLFLFPILTQAAAAASGPTPINQIPAGTILPVVLHTSLVFDKCKPGQALEGKIAQDVPLANRAQIRKGANIEGHVVEVSPNKVTIRFDRLELAGQWVPVVTNLRAIAGFMSIQEAQVPEEAPGEGDPSNWLPTTQIGGDSVYGLNGPVMSAQNTSQVVGKSVAGGVLVTPSPNDNGGCRGAVDNNSGAQALWFFSSDACGVYGIEHLKISHSGRTEPVGTIALTTEKSKLSLRSGDALLLRVD